MRRLAPIAIAAALALTGCAAQGPTRPDGTARAAEHYQVETEVAWNRVQLDRFALWTVDGPQLQQLRFYRPLEPGDRLGSSRGGGESGLRYQGWMRAHDVVDLVTAALARSGSFQVRTEGPKPAPFGDRSGFRFGLTFASQAGLPYRVLGRGWIDGADRLHLVLYLGSQDHYFGAYREEVTRILDSLQPS